MVTIQILEDLQIWQLARDMSNEVFKLMAETTLKTDYRLKEQINGSSDSVMDNIAESFVKRWK